MGCQDSVVEEAYLIQIVCDATLSIFLELGLLSTGLGDMNVDQGVFFFCEIPGPEKCLAAASVGSVRTNGKVDQRIV